MNTPRRVPLGMSRILPSALRSRLAVLFAAAVAVVIAAGVGLLAFATDRQFDAAVDTGLVTRTSALHQAIQRGDVRVVREDPIAELVAPDGTVVETSPAAAVLEARGGRASSTSSFLPATVLAEVRRSGEVSDSIELPRQGRVRFTASPVSVPEAGSVLVVGTRMRELDEAETRLVLLFLAGAPVLVASLGLAGWLLAGAALRPVADLTRRAARISAAELDQRLPQPPGADEVAVLARTLNGMLDRLEAAVRREREFVDDAAHELRTPIAVLRGELELALRLGRDLPADAAESLEAALSEADRLEHLAQDLLLLASAERGVSVRAPVDLTALAEREAPRLAAAHPVQVHVSGLPAVVDGDERALGRLLANLVANAESAGASRVQVRTSLVDGSGDVDGSAGTGGSARPWVRLVVADDGRGFPPELMATATERFTRGDAARTRSSSGAGLGLAIVAAVVTDHGGRLELGHDAELGGAAVSVELPLAR
ncbi:sensor histidine kinase [Quadrisphaera granulorum]|uniref:sensor histidine kinase n=1 Tax=Quadrisphaera granulorum TaxID=317664 RepID=UPI000D6B78FC|nr:ATP-binding protein [Quadrisphaera granulorum]